MLNIRVVLWGIRHDVMNVVVVFPPAHRQTTNEIGDANGDEGVDLVVMCDSNVASIMGGEDKLVPHETQTQATKSILSIM